VAAGRANDAPGRPQTRSARRSCDDARAHRLGEGTPSRGGDPRLGALRDPAGTRRTLAVVFEHGELRLTANGLPIFDRIFLGPEEGSFIALRWRLALRGAAFIGEAGAAALADSLRRLRRTNNAELRRQAEVAGGYVLAHGAAIVRNEMALEAALDVAYGLTDAERGIITK